jgi:hypothetical protein
MSAPSINPVASDERLLHQQPEKRVIYTVSLYRSEQAHWTRLVTPPNEEAIVVGLWPVDHLLGVFTINTSTDIWRSIELAFGKGVEDGIRAEVMTKVVMRHRNGDDRVGSEGPGLFDNRVCICNE